MTTHYAQIEASSGRVTSIGFMSMDLTDAMLAGMGAVRVSEQQHAAMQPEPTHWVHQGEGEFGDAGKEELALGTAQAWAAVQINSAAESARQQFLTPGSGQAMEYQQTQECARRAIAANAAGEPLAAADYPWIEAERLALVNAGAGSPALIEVAETIVATMDGWTVAGAEIKRVRRSAKIAVGAATNVEDVQAILSGLAWPAPQ